MVIFPAAYLNAALESTQKCVCLAAVEGEGLSSQYGPSQHYLECLLV